MKDKFKGFLEKIKKLWGGLTKVVKILVIAGFSVIVIGAVILTIILNSSADDEFIVLFPEMSDGEASEVRQLLVSEGVETKISPDGEIMVRRDEWDTLVYDLAERGYPQSAPSYGTFFDNLGMTMTEFEKKQTLVFQLQDRLQETLKRIHGINNAVVNITLPDNNDYAWKETNEIATASVLLTLSNSAGFTSENVKAVKNLVAFSAQKMKPENVTVTDATTGQVLLSTDELELQNDNSGIDIADKMEYVSVLEARYEDKAKRVLQNKYNLGVDAVASVEIDYDKVIEEMKQLLPDEQTRQGYVTNEHKAYDTNDKPVDEGGVTGEENNDDIPNYQNDEEDNLNSDNTVHYEDDVELDLGYLLTQTERAQGTIRQASISVVVAIESDKYFTRDERNAVIRLVKDATNISEDNISVDYRVINTEDDQKGENVVNSGIPDNIKKILIIAGLGLLLLILIAVALILILARRSKKRRLAEQAQHEAEIAQLQEIIDENERKSIEEQADEHTKKEKVTENEVREFAKNNPEITAALIRSMLKERDE